MAMYMLPAHVKAAMQAGKDRSETGLTKTAPAQTRRLPWSLRTSAACTNSLVLARVLRRWPRKLEGGFVSGRVIGSKLEPGHAAQLSLDCLVTKMSTKECH